MCSEGVTAQKVQDAARTLRLKQPNMSYVSNIPVEAEMIGSNYVK